MIHKLKRQQRRAVYLLCVARISTLESATVKNAMLGITNKSPVDLMKNQSSCVYNDNCVGERYRYLLVHAWVLLPMRLALGKSLQRRLLVGVNFCRPSPFTKLPTAAVLRRPFLSRADTAFLESEAIKTLVVTASSSPRSLSSFLPASLSAASCSHSLSEERGMGSENTHEGDVHAVHT